MGGNSDGVNSDGRVDRVIVQGPTNVDGIADVLWGIADYTFNATRKILRLSN